MARSNNQKLKLLYLMKLLTEETDDNNHLSMVDIQTALAEYDITAERKSLYDDIEMLRRFGLDIIGEREERGHGYGYHIGQRRFELAELKLLVDAVQASKFITVKKSMELIKKLETLTSKHNAGQLQRQVYVLDRVKTMNESIYLNVDTLHYAIGQDVRIHFQYSQWTVGKELQLRRDGGIYEVSPWALFWNNENYYLVAYDTEQEMIKHYRVDKIVNLIVTDIKRAGVELFEKCDMAVYTRKMFGMFQGVEEQVKIEFPDELAGVVIDRFGKGVIMRAHKTGFFVATVKVAVSRQFIAWVIGLGEQVEILSPESVVNEMRETIASLSRLYERKKQHTSS